MPKHYHSDYFYVLEHFSLLLLVLFPKITIFAEF